MSHSTNAKSLNSQEHPKVYQTQYLLTAGEPKDFISKDASIELEADVLENSYFMRRLFRHEAKRLRASAHKEQALL